MSEIVTRLKSLLPVVFLLASAFLGVPSLVQPARATTTGLVCIADQSLNPTDCPAEPANLTGNIGDIVTVAVNVQGVDSLNGFDIAVQVNPAVLQPVSISLADSIMGNDCHDLQGGCRLIVAQSVNSTSGVARLAMVILSISVPGAGDLFEIVYKVLSSSNGSAFVFSVCPPNRKPVSQVSACHWLTQALSRLRCRPRASGL